MGNGHKNYIKCFYHPIVTFSNHSTYVKMNSSLIPSIVGRASLLLFIDELYASITFSIKKTSTFYQKVQPILSVQLEHNEKDSSPSRSVE